MLNAISGQELFIVEARYYLFSVYSSKEILQTRIPRPVLSCSAQLDSILIFLKIEGLYVNLQTIANTLL